MMMESHDLSWNNTQDPYLQRAQKSHSKLLDLACRGDDDGVDFPIGCRVYMPLGLKQDSGTELRHW